MKTLKPQVVAIYRHEERKLAYVSLINEDRKDKEGRVDQQYSRARSSHKAMLSGAASEISSGFIFALINTDFAGWEVELLEDIVSGAEASHARDAAIERLIADGYKFVGAERSYSKGVYGNMKTPANWNKKFNVGNMKMAQIFEKIEFMFRAAIEQPTREICNQVYFAIACPGSYGPRHRNFGTYEVDSMANMFLYVRNLNGHDLP